ncbi:TPA: DEAD/DEAH box helicase family protein [Methanocaldococcus jannaschii]|uniref:Putative ATP-dependent RNA helicase MJ1505 n=2 Tax=Methanocaldococcus jannaschii TaxID=2190 RepID=Y1505_METJA|nr:DEAD/DEAH box helicase [Methanocaldococcus jannaschii]Q58900.2 RecName: Full=Putative ATP-dependent RNA helicase MJ1505 [Methanocaldococcus jannaschii DSM 2661]AAB99518.1 ATP dependent RNA helicase, putative [Methanocaldococcus jannaschii DSM 2661]HII59140.1 DEAD/DEAH box helicase family protein [Methanocaldococcus jannaschii]
MFIEHPLIKPKTLEARLYQQIIAANALKKKTLCVLSTGLGKTAIAILVIAGILTKKDGKVLILAPSRPLVEQHYNRLKQVLNIDEDKIIALTGKIQPKKRAELYKKGKIFIATPQVIENDIIAGRINVDEFILLIADEAHHTTGDHAYAFVAKKFKDKCHILGLTASPGSDIDKVMEICENLGIEHVEVRTEDDEDVKPYIAKVKLIPIRIDLPNEFKRALKLINEALKERLKILKDAGVINSIADVTKTELIELNNKLFSYDEEVKYELIKVCSEALKLMHAKELLESQGKSVFLNYINKLSMQRTKSAKSIVNDEKVREAVNLLMKSDVEHPKLGKVVDMVKNILEKNKDERIIIFAQYRDTVEKIVNLLTQNGIKAIRFIGQANKEGKGMSQKEQIEAIERFKKEGSVLVSTSVSEEGIDIPSVNYIIFYEPVPSEIRFIQRRGRAMRGEGGKVYVLIAKGTADEAYYRSALYKEREMKRLLKNMCYLLNKRLQKKFEEKSKEEIKEETEEIKEKEIESKTAVKEETKEEEEKTKKPVTILDFIKQIEVKERSKSEEDKIKQEIKIPKKPIKIIVDVREKNMAKLLHNYANIELKTLEVGDYVLSDRVVVERKTAEDFVNSIIDKRLFSQLKNLKKVEKPLLIVEGENFSRLHENALKGAILSIILDFGIPIIFTKNAEETADLLIKIAEKEQIKEKRTVMVRYGKTAMSLKEQQKFIVESLPDVGGALAERLLKHFKTVENVFTAKEEELMKVEGVGKERAKKIREVLTAEYEG